MGSDSDDTPHDHEVELWIPGDSRHIGAARAVAAALGADLGFDLDQIDDLRIALSEAVGVALENQTPTPKLHVRFSVSGDQVTMSVTRSDGLPLPPMDLLAERILASVVDSSGVVGHEIVMKKSRNLRS